MSGSSVTTWTGWDVRGGTSARPDAADAFARLAPVHEEARYELIAVAARGFRPPRFVRVAAASDGLGPSGPEGSWLRRVWSVRYRQIAETAPPEPSPFAIYLLGVNPPPGATDEELDAFNDFYTNVHLPEVAERRRARRAVRYELLDDEQPPYLGAPRFLAVYEVDEAGAAARRHVGPAYSAGPDVWQHHTTPWRLWYRRVEPVSAPT
jgi:hypothetical protein